MKLLKHYVNNINAWNQLFGTAPIEFPLTAENIAMIVDQLSSKLSPENLHCDGEITRAEAKHKYDYLMDVHADLVAYTTEHRIELPELNY